MLRSKGLKRSSVRPVLYAIELFFDMNKKILHKTVLRKMVQGIPDHIKGGEKAYTDDDIRKMLGIKDALFSRFCMTFFYT